MASESDQPGADAACRICRGHPVARFLPPASDTAIWICDSCRAKVADVSAAMKPIRLPIGPAEPSACTPAMSSFQRLIDAWLARPVPAVGALDKPKKNSPEAISAKMSEIGEARVRSNLELLGSLGKYLDTRATVITALPPDADEQRVKLAADSVKAPSLCHEASPLFDNDRAFAALRQLREAESAFLSSNPGLHEIRRWTLEVKVPRWNSLVEPIKLCVECARCFIPHDRRDRFCSPSCGTRARNRGRLKGVRVVDQVRKRFRKHVAKCKRARRGAFCAQCESFSAQLMAGDTSPNQDALNRGRTVRFDDERD